MSRRGPIIIVEDDHDDREILIEIFQRLDIKNELKFFDDGQKTFDYVITTDQQPFIILCDVNLPKMLGTELRKCINENDYLRRKSIPFVFLTTSANPKAVEEAYDQMVQGYFQKAPAFEQMKKMIKQIIDYWMVCKHPNNTE